MPQEVLFPPAPFPFNTPITHSIVQVKHGPGGNDEIIVTVSGTIVQIFDYAEALEVYDGEQWLPAIGGNFDTPPDVLFLFGAEVIAATQWRVPSAAAWEFADGPNLQPPLTGLID